MQAELVEVEALPAHRDLQQAMQLTQGAIDWHQQPAPDHGADVHQPDFELQDLAAAGDVASGEGACGARFIWPE